jgi:hypothetical protein
MDEYDSGMDPEVKKYFRKIMNSFSLGLLWMLIFSTAGLFMGLGIIRNGLQWYNILFYIIAIASFIGLLFYFYKVWK